VIRITLLFLLLTFYGNAQRFDSGIQIGAIASQLSGDQAAGYDKPGFEVGGMVSTQLNDKSNLGFQLMYIQKGSRKAQHPEIGDYTFYRSRLNYVQVPLFFQYQFSNKISFEAATGLAMLLGSEEEDQYGKIEDRKAFSRLEWIATISMNYLLFENFQLILGAENSVLPVRRYDGTELYRLDKDQYNSLLRFAARFKIKPTQE